MIADKKQEVFVGVKGLLVQIRRGSLLAAMDRTERIDARSGLVNFHFTFFGDAGLFDREIASALQRQCVGGVENRLDSFQADARVFDVLAHPVGVTFEGLDGVLRPGRAKGEIVLEEIVVAVNVRDRGLVAPECCRA